MSGVLTHTVPGRIWHSGGANEADESVTRSSDDEIIRDVFVLDGKKERVNK